MPDLSLNTRWLPLVHISLSALIGCTGNRGTTTAGSDPTVTVTSNGPTTSTLTTTTLIDPTTSAPTTSATHTTEASTATTAALPGCPNGKIDEGEACDDGNRLNGDGCNNDCTKSAELLREYRSGEPGDDRIRCIAVDVDGIVVGAEAGLVRKVARFDFDLMQQWAETYGESSIGIVNGVAVARDAIYAAGAVYSDVDGHDIWIARLSPKGLLEWEDINSSGFGNDYLNQVSVVADDTIVVTGLASVDGGLTSVWTRWYSPDKSPLWTASYPLGTEFKIYPLGPGLAVAPGAVVVGWTLPSENYASLLVAYPPGGGDSLWAQSLPVRGGITAIARDPGGDLVVVGSEDQKLLVARTTSDGIVQWSSYDCTGGSGRDVAIDSQGDIVVIGDGAGSNGVNIRLCKFTPEGELRWGQDIDGGFGDDRGFTVAIGPSDRIIAGGAVRSDQNKDDSWLAVFSP